MSRASPAAGKVVRDGGGPPSRTARPGSGIFGDLSQAQLERRVDRRAGHVLAHQVVHRLVVDEDQRDVVEHDARGSASYSALRLAMSSVAAAWSISLSTAGLA